MKHHSINEAAPSVVPDQIKKQAHRVPEWIWRIALAFLCGSLVARIAIPYAMSGRSIPNPGGEILLVAAAFLLPLCFPRLHKRHVIRTAAFVRDALHPDGKLVDLKPGEHRSGNLRAG